MQDVAYIPLWARDGTIRAYAIVDKADEESLNRYRWSLSNGRPHRTYRSRGRQPGVLMYRQILGLKPGDPHVDHRNGNLLDNRRENLRLATRSQNLQNRSGPTRASKSGVRGVCWLTRDRRWHAQATVAGAHHHLGNFHSKVEAEAVVVAFRREHMPFSEMDHRE